MLPLQDKYLRSVVRRRGKYFLCKLARSVVPIPDAMFRGYEQLLVAGSDLHEDGRSPTRPLSVGDASKLRCLERQLCLKIEAHFVEKPDARRALIATHILTTPAGRPWLKRHFSRQWKDTCDRAGIDGLHFHDLRGTSVTLLAEAGCDTPQIAAITGHTLRSASAILEKYMARTRTQGALAMAKLENYLATNLQTALQTVSGPFANSRGDEARPLILLVPPRGLEPRTPRSTIWCSNQLS